MAFIPPAIAAISALTSTAAASAGAATGIAGASTLAAASLPTIAGISTASVPLAATPWLATAGLASTAVGGITGAVGSYEQGQAAAKSAKYNAAVANNNATLAKQNAAISGQAGAQQAGISSEKTRAEVGAIKANQAASGLDVNSGSDVDVRSSAQELGELDALTVRSNAAKEAYGYNTQSDSFSAEANLDKAEAGQDSTSGIIGAGSTLLNSAGTGVTNYEKYQLAGGFSY